MITHIPTKHSYSAAVEAGDYIFLGLHAGGGGTFTEQIHGAIAAIRETLSQCGSSLDRLVKVNVHLRSIQDLPEMERVFAGYFEQDRYPARMTTTTEFIEPSVLIMIDGIAYNG